MKRILLLTSLLAVALALPSGASARVVELGAHGRAARRRAAPPTRARPSCGSRATRAAVGRAQEPVLHPARRLARGVHRQLSKPAAEQIDVLQRQLRLAAEVQLSVLRRGTTRKTRLNHRLVTQSEPLRRWRTTSARARPSCSTRPLRVNKGNWIAITVPTWAPMLADDLRSANWWRSSRREGQVRAAAQPAPVRAWRSCARSALRLHLQRRAAALHGHVRPGQPGRPSPDEVANRRSGSFRPRASR